MYAVTGGDGWIGALLGLAVGEGGRLFVPGRDDSGSGGRSVHLRPQGAQGAVAVAAALDSTSLTATGVTDGSSGATQRTIALVLVVIAGIGLAAVSIREWRGGAGGRSMTELWQQVWARRPGAGRSA